MKIVNIMLSQGLGGLEQAFVDYCEALKLSGHTVAAIIDPKCGVKASLENLYLEAIEISNWGVYDLWAGYKIKKALKHQNPDCVIVHGARAATLSKGSGFPTVGVAHTHNKKRLMGLDGVITITEKVRHEFIQKGMGTQKVKYVPNMIRLPSEDPFTNRKQISTPLKIGALGRLVPKKGFSILIEALALLKNQGLHFKCVIGGDGEEKIHLQSLVQNYNLADQVHFIGWVQDKEIIYKDIDIFCVPSLIEPFGIILLEGWSYGCPLIVTDTEGPVEIVTHLQDGYIVPKGNAEALAEAIKKLMEDDHLRQELTIQGFKTLRSHYDIQVVCHVLNKAIHEILSVTS
jgi:glycosyltransferase involved in cell wall biosynthesis